jgi:hypothetical protein
MPPDFLNSREDAVLLWALLIVGYVTYKDRRAIGGAFVSLVRVALHPKLVLLFGSALVYSMLLVSAAKVAGVWHTTALKATAYWFVGTAVVLIAHAVTRASARDREFIRSVLKRVIGVTILIELVVNLYALPLAVEVIGVGIVLTFSMLKAFAESDASTDPSVRRLIDGVLAAVGLVYLGYVAGRGAGDLLDGVGRERAEEFLIGPALTIALIPFLYAVAWWSSRDTQTLRKRARSGSGDKLFNLARPH